MMTRRWLRAALWASLLAAGSADASAAEVSVGGGVAHPGRYATNGGKGLIALLLEAGGIANGCSEVRVVGSTEGKPRVYRVNLWELMIDFQPDWTPQPGDTIYVNQHAEACLRDPQRFNELMREYLDARATKPQPPAGWKKKVQGIGGGCGKLHYEEASKGRG